METVTDKIRRRGFPLCIEKARLITESYQQTEGEQSILRHAKAFSYMLENMPVLIDNDELFVGEGASKPWGAEIDPFLGVWREEEVRAAADRGLSILTKWTGRCSENLANTGRQGARSTFNRSFSMKEYSDTFSSALRFHR
jgi:formate C-acetyltransferase